MFEKKPKNTSNWLDITPDKLTYPPLSGDTTADVAVIGGGLTGILSAWRLAQKGLSVVLIEKNHLCTGDTSLTTGFLLSIPDASISEIEKNKGLAFAKRYYETMSLAKDEIAHIIKTYNIDCDFAPCAAYYGSNAKNDQTLTNELETIKNIDPEVALISKKELPILPFKEAIHFPHEAKWNARKFAFNLLKHESSRQI
jgi:glycine/D-amino acid oxidase-like deaminating enzyme